MPAIWTQMVATQNQRILWEIQRVGELTNKAAKIGGRHSGITAELVHLIGGRFNQ